MIRRQFLNIAVYVTATALAGGKSSAQAQGNGDKKGGDKKAKGKDKEGEVQVDGTIRQVSSQGLLVDGEDGNKYLIGVTGASQVTLQGAADLAFLTAGAYFEFEAELDRNGNLTGPIASVTLVEASNLNPPGLFPISVLDGNTPIGEATAAYLVRGKLVSYRDKTLLVQTGRKNVVAKLEEGAALQARFDNWSLAAVGDEVRANVELVPQINTGVTRVTARKVTVRAAETIRPAGTKRP